MSTSVSFDLTAAGNLCNGTIELSGGIITVSDGESRHEYSLQGIESVTLRTDIGCGSLELVPVNADADMAENIRICRFSMTKVEENGEFCKVVNHYLKTGEETEISTAGFRSCPQCGRHYLKGMDTCLFCIKKSYLASRMWQIAKPFSASILLAGIFITLSSGANALVPVLNARLVDKYLYAGGSAANERGIIITVLLMAAAQVLSVLFKIVSQRRANRASAAMSNSLRMQVYDKIQQMSVSSLSGKTSGDLMKRVSRDTETVKDFITEQGLYLIEKLTMFIVILVVLLRISPVLTGIVLLPVPFVIVAISRFWEHIRVRYGRQWRCDSRSNSILHDIIRGIRVVKTFGSEEREIAKFAVSCKKLAKVQTSNEHLWALTFPFISFFMGIGEFLVLWFGGRMVLEGRITVGCLLEFNLYLAYIYQPLRWISSLPKRLGEATTSLVKILEIIDEDQSIKDSDTPVRANLAGDIVFKDVQFGYKAYEPVLKDISLEVKQGEMIGLVGHSGAGKSTLINLIMRLYDVDGGTISVGGVDIRDMAQTDYRDKIGVVFQENFLFNGSVYDNIAYARPTAEPCEIIAAAKAANAHDFIMKLPDGYNTIVGEDGHNLSGGERQRVSIARAVLKNPQILILDEATSALDPETESAIQEALARLVKGRTTFAIAHRLSTLRNADRLVVIEKGHIAEVGTHRDLLLQNGIYAGLVMAQRQTAKLKN